MLIEIQHAVRLLYRNLGLSLVVVFVLALGIGANVATFGVIDGALFRKLPYRDPGQLVDVVTVVRDQGRTTRFIGIRSWSTPGELRALTSIFQSLDCYVTGRQMVFGGAGSTERVLVGKLSEHVLENLGIRMKLGRSFSADDVLLGDAAILSATFWQQVFGADAAIVGKEIILNGQRYRVVGVAPSSARYLIGTDVFNSERNAVWLPLNEGIASTDELQVAGFIGRLRDGLNQETAQKELTKALAGLRERNPSSWKPTLDLEVQPLGYLRVHSPPRTMLLLLWGAVWFLFLIACANVTNLMLYRAQARQQEIAIRSALGATPATLRRQFLIEGLVLATVACVASLIVAVFIMRILPSVLPDPLADVLFSAYEPQLDLRSLLFAPTVAWLSGLVCATAPVLRVSRLAAVSSPDVRGTPGQSRDQRRMTHLFQVVQVAITLVLMIGFGLTLNSFVRMLKRPDGFNSDSLLYVRILTSYKDPTAKRVFFDELLARVKALPTSKQVTLGPPPPTGFALGRVSSEGASEQVAAVYTIPADYFSVASIPVLRGRPFSAADETSSPTVAVISDTAAQRLWPGQEAVGKRLRDRENAPWMTVIGVVNDIKTINFTQDVGDVQVYKPVDRGNSDPYGLLIRTNGETKSAVAAVDRIVKEIDERQEIRRAGDVASMYEPSLEPTRFGVFLGGTFAAAGLLAASIGLFGLISYSVNQRTAELGLRLALGARPTSLGLLVFRDAMHPVIIGLVFGVIGALWLMRFLSGFLYGVRPFDLPTVGASVLFFSVISALAVCRPMMRAVRIDPAAALRSH